MRATLTKTITLQGRKVEYRVTPSRAAKKLRVRVGPRGIEVVRPTNRPSSVTIPFLRGNEQWILDALDRAEHFRPALEPIHNGSEVILFRGTPTRVHVVRVQDYRGPNRVLHQNGALSIRFGTDSGTSPACSLENWLRNQARHAIEQNLENILARLKRRPNKVYVMGQRTKWGNCSTLGNLSFNWRLILAPDFVLHYLVTHEAVHLAVPDHSKRFWLTLQSLCPETEIAKEWLRVNSDKLMVDLRRVVADSR